MKDIDGTKPNPYNLYKIRSNYVPEEIEGTKSKKLFVPRDHIDILDVKDINEYRVFRTKRRVDPLDPEYIVQNEDG